MSARLLAVSVLLVVPALAGVVGAPRAAAAPRTITEPAEYGTDVRHDPFDYSQSTDLMTERDVNVGVNYVPNPTEGTTRFEAAGNSRGDWYVSPVWMTFPHHVDPNSRDLPDADGGALPDQHDGVSLPIDADRYTHLSMRVHVDEDPGPVFFDWFSCQEWLTPCRGRMTLPDLEPGWNTIEVPIAANSPGAGLPREWEDTVYGIRLAGQVDAPRRITLDWFRLHDSAPEHEVTVTGAARNRLTYNSDAAMRTPQRADSRQTWGTLDATAADPVRQTTTVDVGGLPPGTWYLHDGEQVLEQVTIAPRPRPTILDPDAAGGADYATEVLGNAWDFSSAADVRGVGNSRDVRFANGELSAVNTTNDPHVLLPLGPDGLDPVHYHRVTVDQHYDAAFNLDDGKGPNNPRPGGSHGRLLWRTARHTASAGDCAQVSDGREFVFFKTWDTYTYDMRDVPPAQGMRSSAEPNIGVTYCRATAPDPHWSDKGPITELRFDPHEAPSQYRWYVNDMRIAADDAADPTFDIRWRDDAAIPGTEVTVRLDDNRGGYDGEVLGTVTQQGGVNSITFDATDRLPGTYWVNLTSRTPDGRVGRDDATGPLQVSPRISGRDRIATAVEASRQSVDTARVAIVASAASFPDALVSVQLADAVAGPVLLTDPSSLDQRVERELDRLGVREVVIAGGKTAVSSSVARSLERGGRQVTRLGGATRYETSIAIARETLRRRGQGTAGRVVVTTGENFPDALAAGPWVGYADLPLVMARPEQERPPRKDGTPRPPRKPDNRATRQFLDQVEANRVTVLGGPTALSDRVAKDVAGARRWDRVAGSDRFETARRLTDAAVAAGGSRRDVLVATGRNYPDALSAGPAVLARGGVLALTEKDGVPAPTRAFLGDTASWRSWRVVGGPVAVSHATVRALREVAGL